jgi:hypothetical protein
MIVLSGGPLAGKEMDADGWVVGARRYFIDDSGAECTYWRYDDTTAVYEGMGRIQ